MKELLLAFILALIVGSIINGWPRPPVKPAQNQAGTQNTGSQTSPLPGPHRDFPDFNSFPSLNQANFGALVLTSQKPVFIICYSPNNLAYERMVPLIAALAQDHADSVQVARLNVMENAPLAHEYRIITVPSYLVFSKGKVTAQLAGIVAKDKLETMIATAN